MNRHRRRLEEFPTNGSTCKPTKYQNETMATTWLSPANHDSQTDQFEVQQDREAAFIDRRIASLPRTRASAHRTLTNHMKPRGQNERPVHAIGVSLRAQLVPERTLASSTANTTCRQATLRPKASLGKILETSPLGAIPQTNAKCRRNGQIENNRSSRRQQKPNLRRVAHWLFCSMSQTTARWGPTSLLLCSRPARVGKHRTERTGG